MEFQNVAEKDRHYICEIGRLFWGDNKQCYAPDAVYHRVKKLIESQAQRKDSANQGSPTNQCSHGINWQNPCSQCGRAIVSRCERCGYSENTHPRTTCWGKEGNE